MGRSLKDIILDPEPIRPDGVHAGEELKKCWMRGTDLSPPCRGAVQGNNVGLCMDHFNQLKEDLGEEQ